MFTMTRRRIAIAALVAAGLLAGGGLLWLRDAGVNPIDPQVARLHLSRGLNVTEVDRPAPAPALRLPTTTGSIFDLAAQQGRVVAVVFGYTHCPDVCPTTLADYAGALGQLSAEERAQVRLVFVTLDPDRDTPEALRRYLAAFDPGFVGLTGSASEVAETTRRWQFAYVREAPEPGGSYLISHDAFSFLVDRRGNKRAIVPTFTPTDSLAAELRRLIKEQ